MKISREVSDFSSFCYPKTAMLVTCSDENNKTNAITIAWHTTISKNPPLYGISIAPSRFSYELIKNSKEFIVNFMPYEMVDTVHYCGTHSGKKKDKIKEINLSLEPSKTLKTEQIKSAYAHLECSLYDSIKLGDHSFIIGKVEHVSVDNKSFKDKLLTKQIKPLLYLGNNVYTTVIDETTVL